MGQLQERINSMNGQIAELQAQRAEIERNYGESPHTDRLKRSLLQPLDAEITSLQLEVRAVQTSWALAQEQEIDTMFAQASEERALQARRAERTARKEAERTRHDRELAGWNWEMSGIDDKPRIFGGKVYLTDQHRAIGRNFAAQLAEQREKTAQFSSEAGQAAIAESAARFGISVAEVRGALGLDAPPAFREATVNVDGVYYDIVQDAQGVYVERNILRTIDDEMSGGGDDSSDSDGGGE